jgi:hypothetical protein
VLTDEEVLVIVKRNLERQFPKTCACCGRTFPSFADFVLQLHTMHRGDPMCVDAEMGDWEPRDDEGTLGLTNCACGTTLALGSKGIGLPTMGRLLRWARARTRERGVTIGQVLADLRTWVDARVFEEQQASRRESTP